ncbi:DUF948 domain-containing protein [Candidatus Magnetomonas plexicatena]|uniref:DUF948 domain-containing protein n=1 Tax=Candidatus Magnetomonas plexicatena TaxID=2552947 RepID=UPI0011023E43|nr:DUF948 domain-containing protein [Nitrospirales bacterium LBB_01]
MDTKLFLLLSFVLLAVLVPFLVHILIQVSRMIGSLTGLIKTTDTSLSNLMSEVTVTVKTANNIVKTIDEVIAGFREFLGALKELGEGAKKLSSALKDSVGYFVNLMSQTSGLLGLLKKAIEMLMKGIKKKGGQNEQE